MWIIHSSRELWIDEVLKLQSVYGPYFFMWYTRINGLPKNAMVASGHRDALKYITLKDLQRSVPCVTRIEYLRQEPFVSVRQTIVCTILLAVLLLINAVAEHSYSEILL